MYIQLADVSDMRTGKAGEGRGAERRSGVQSPGLGTGRRPTVVSSAPLGDGPSPRRETHHWDP